MSVLAYVCVYMYALMLCVLAFLPIWRGGETLTVCGSAGETGGIGPAEVPLDPTREEEEAN